VILVELHDFKRTMANIKTKQWLVEKFAMCNVFSFNGCPTEGPLPGTAQETLITPYLLASVAFYNPGGGACARIAAGM